MVEAQEVAAISLECQECRSRVEVPPGGGYRRASSPALAAGSASRIDATIGAFLRMIEEAQAVRGMRFRVRLLRDLP